MAAMNSQLLFVDLAFIMADGKVVSSHMCIMSRLYPGEVFVLSASHISPHTHKQTHAHTQKMTEKEHTVCILGK